MRAKHWLVLGLALMLAIPFAARTSAAPSKVTLTVGIDQEAVGLDPNKVTAFASFRRIGPVVFLYKTSARPGAT